MVPGKNIPAFIIHIFSLWNRIRASIWAWIFYGLGVCKANYLKYIFTDESSMMIFSIIFTK
jgi:hypothetical protein